MWFSFFKSLIYNVVILDGFANTLHPEATLVDKQTHVGAELNDIVFNFDELGVNGRDLALDLFGATLVPQRV